MREISSAVVPQAASLLATTVIPWRLIDGSGRALWNNRNPQFVRFCRSLKHEFTKETEAVNLAEDRFLKMEIEGLEKLIIN